MFGFLAKFAGGAIGKVMGGLGLGKIQLIILVALLTTLGIQTLVIKLMSNKIETAVAVIAAKDVALATNKEAFENFKTQANQMFEQQARAVEQLAQSREQAEKEKHRLSKKLQRHDLGHLARKKPGLIERRVNKATAELFEKIGWENERVIDSETAQIILWNERYATPCWLLHSTDARIHDFLPGCSVFYRHSSETPEAGPSAPEVGDTRRGTRKDLWIYHQREPGAFRAPSEAVRDYGPRFFRDQSVSA